jgi:hypothetical protein
MIYQVIWCKAHLERYYKKKGRYDSPISISRAYYDAFRDLTTVGIIHCIGMSGASCWMERIIDAIKKLPYVEK